MQANKYMTPTTSQERRQNSDEGHASTIDFQRLTHMKPMPVLPNGTAVLLEALGDPTQSFEKLASTLGNFPVLVTRLLSLANSPWSSPASPVTTIDQAISRLGLDTVRSVTIALTVSAPFKVTQCSAFDSRRYWCSALLAAHTASQIALATQSTIGVQPPIARTAGLMHNIGLLWLADIMPKETNKALMSVIENPEISVDASLMSVCGISYCHAGEILSKAWNIPQPIATGMAYHLPTPAGSVEANVARLITLVTAMISSFYNKSAVGVDSALYECLTLDADTYATVYDDLESTYPLIDALAETLFFRRNE